MILAGLGAFMLFAFAGADEQQQVRPRPVQDGLGGVRQQFIIRVTTGIRRVPAGSQTLIEWREGRGPRCVPASRIIGAAFPSQNSVDLILRDRTRMRARLERRCAALDFYRSFYVNATEDGLICADRDFIRSRTGGTCQIDQFRTLRAQVQR